MARPKGNVAIAAWQRFAAVRRAHYVDGTATRGDLARAAVDLQEWAEAHAESGMDPDFGKCPDLEEFTDPAFRGATRR